MNRRDKNGHTIKLSMKVVDNFDEYKTKLRVCLPFNLNVNSLLSFYF